MAAEQSKAATRQDGLGPFQEGQLAVHTADPAAAPLVLGLVPDPVGYFVDREQQLALAAALEGGGGGSAGGDGSVTGRLLTGTGGAGKTTLAASYCRGLIVGGDGPDLVMWVTSNSTPAVTGAYAEAARTLDLAEAGEDSDHAARRFLGWLRSSGRDWLLVLDDVQSPGSLDGLWPPRDAKGRGRVIVTTRSREGDFAALSGYSFLQVGVFTPGQSLSYLRRTLGAGLAAPPADDDLAGLAEDLGHLPLALSRAAAYLEFFPSCSVSRYRRLLADRRLGLQRLTPGVRGSTVSTSVAALWDISIDQADLHASALARPLLELAAFLDGTVGIPDGLFTTEWALEYVGERSEQAGTVDALDCEHALATLNRLNLVDHSPAADGSDEWLVRVHQLIQRAVREHSGTGESGHGLWNGSAAVAAANALLDVWPDTETDQQLAGRLRAHAGVLSAFDQDDPDHWLWRDSHAYLVLFKLGTSAGASGDARWACRHFEVISVRAEGCLGADHEHSLAARHQLALWQSASGAHTAAVETLEDLVARHTRLSGSETPATLVLRHNLAVALGEAGDTTAAVTGLAGVLAARRAADVDRGQILATLHNLAYWKRAAGDAAGAAVSYRTLIPEMEEEFGAEDERTLTARHNLARCVGEAGDPLEAVALLTVLAPIQNRVLGPLHPRVLTTRHSLARWQGEGGSPDAAIDSYRALLVDMRAVLGADHPQTLAARHNLGHLRAASGDVEALEDLNAVAADQARVLGSDHPDTFASRRSAAFCLSQAGAKEDALRMAEAVLSDQQRALAPDHPGLLAGRQDVAILRGLAGDFPSAVMELHLLLPELAQVFGPGHPLTLSALGRLSDWAAVTGDVGAAVDGCSALLTAVEDCLGRDNAAWLTVLDKLAMWRGHAGDPAEAIRLLTQMLDGARRLLGDQDPVIPVIEGNIAHWRGQLPTTGRITGPGAGTPDGPRQ
ncbi:tetratricopeptide repeat protein [Streptomyces sp. 900105755]